MKFSNRQFGEIDYEEKYLLDFPEGIIGFGEFNKFVIINDEDTQPFRWLVSVEDPDLNFPMIDPDLVAEGYRSTYIKEGDSMTFLIVALKDPLNASTINLRSPLVIDNASKVGRQVILQDDSLSMQYPLFTRESAQVE
jgi:flagellar assembly factor FliW